MLARLPEALGVMGRVIIIGILPVRPAPMRAFMKLSIHLEHVTFSDIRPFVVMRDNRAAPNLPRGFRTIVPINVVVLLDRSCTTPLPFRPVQHQTAIVKLIVAENETRALVSINSPLTAGIIKHIILDENKLFGPPMRVVCPRSVAVIPSIPPIVENVNGLHPREVKPAMVYH